MRKICLAFFMAILMLLVPITTVAYRSDITIADNFNVSNEEEIPRFYITELQNQTLNSFVENNFEGTEKEEAIVLLEEVIKEDLEVNISALANKFSLYVYIPIPESKLNDVKTSQDLDDLLEEYWGVTEQGFISNLFSQLILKIFEMIQDRLGWLYKAITDGTSLVYNGINLFINVVKDKLLLIALLFVMIVNDILAAPQTFITAIKELFQNNPDAFNITISEFLDNFKTDIFDLIDEIKSFITNEDILDYIDETQEFIDWIDEDPWEDPIHVTGNVITILNSPRTDVTVSCRGQTTNTDSNGEFDYYVNPNPDSESIPDNKYYGMHNCMITISDSNGEIKSTIKLLSYCFSGGKISWMFITKSKSKDYVYRLPIFKIFEDIIIKINTYLSNIFPEYLPART